MTSQEALAGLSRLQVRFKPHRYRGADLNPVWGELLQCRVGAFNQAVGWLEMNAKFLPRPDYLLEWTRFWEKRMEAGEARPISEQKLDAETAAKRSLALVRGYLAGSLPLADYALELYQLSDQTGSAEYAEAAQRAELVLVQKQGAASCESLSTAAN